MKLEVKKAVVNPKKAEEFLAINTYPGQRPRSERHSQELAEKMIDGRFHVGEIAVINNGKPILANGQHQCAASIISGKPFQAVVQEYTIEKGDTKEDVARVFAQFNVDRARSRGDIAWIYGCQMGMESWPRKCVTLCNTALGWLETGCPDKGYNAMSKDANALLLGKNKKQCEFIRQMLFDGNGAHRHLVRASIVAAMISTWNKSRSDAEVFWSAVRDGDMLRQGEPTFVLREYLMRTSVNFGAGANAAGKQPVGFRELYVKAIFAWNAYRSGEEKLRLLRYNQSHPLPKVK